jgi:hypothetical protein
VARKRFSELDLLRIWIVPTAAFMICAAGFVGGVLAEKKQNRLQLPLISDNVQIFGIPAHTAYGLAALGMYSWFFAVAVVDVDRKRSQKSNDRLNE